MIKQHIADAAMHKARYYESLYQLEVLTQKEVSLNSEVIQDLAADYEEGKEQIVSDEQLAAFQAEIADAPAPFTCEDGSCSIQHATV